MTERQSPEPLKPWQVYFSALRSMQHREDEKIEITKTNLEYIVFLAKQDKIE
jgi:hypothetical protein